MPNLDPFFQGVHDRLQTSHAITKNQQKAAEDLSGSRSEPLNDVWEAKYGALDQIKHDAWRKKNQDNRAASQAERARLASPAGSMSSVSSWDSRGSVSTAPSDYDTDDETSTKATDTRSASPSTYQSRPDSTRQGTSRQQRGFQALFDLDPTPTEISQRFDDHRGRQRSRSGAHPDSTRLSSIAFHGDSTLASEHNPQRTPRDHRQTKRPPPAMKRGSSAPPPSSKSPTRNGDYYDDSDDVSEESTRPLRHASSRRHSAPSSGYNSDSRAEWSAAPPSSYASPAPSTARHSGPRVQSSRGEFQPTTQSSTASRPDTDGDTDLSDRRTWGDVARTTGYYAATGVGLAAALYGAASIYEHPEVITDHVNADTVRSGLDALKSTAGTIGTGIRSMGESALSDAGSYLSGWKSAAGSCASAAYDYLNAGRDTVVSHIPGAVDTVTGYATSAASHLPSSAAVKSFGVEAGKKLAWTAAISYPASVFQRRYTPPKQGPSQASRSAPSQVSDVATEQVMTEAEWVAMERQKRRYRV